MGFVATVCGAASRILSSHQGRSEIKNRECPARWEKRGDGDTTYWSDKDVTPLRSNSHFSSAWSGAPFTRAPIGTKISGKGRYPSENSPNDSTNRAGAHRIRVPSGARTALFTG